MKIKAYAAKEKGGRIEAFEYEPKELGPEDIEVKISHCGVCHSDLHLLNDDFGMTQFPFVPGHEITGTVTAKGEKAMFAIGDMVGIGWQSGSCGECAYCRHGEENLCALSSATCVSGFGGYAEKIRINSRFALKIPAGLAPSEAAPLLCGGVTVYTPFKVYGVRPWMKVGVIGIGGLGHLALQFARAMGCEVTAFSTSENKEKEALALGAHNFVSTRKNGVMTSLAGRFDFIISTVSADVNWGEYINALAPKGRLSIVGVPENEIKFHAFPLLVGQRSVSGSVIGSPSTIGEMLEFSARNGVKAKTEIYKMSEVNDVFERVRANKVRYRAVLEN